MTYKELGIEYIESVIKDNRDVASREVAEYVVSMNGQKHKPQSEDDANTLAEKLKRMFPELKIEVVKKWNEMNYMR